MSEEIRIDDVEREELTPDVVSARCKTYEFAGRKLHPFSKSRQTAAMQIEVSAFIGAPEEERRANFALDVQKLIWLCWVDAPMIYKVCAQRKIAVPLIMQWWDQHGADFGSQAWIDAAETYANIIEDIETVSATVDGTGSKSDGDSLGESSEPTQTM
jgi:hypothetical protein